MRQSAMRWRPLIARNDRRTLWIITFRADALSAATGRLMGQKILIIDGHPDPERGRLCHALAEAYVEGAMAAGKQIRLITLAETPIEILRNARDFASAPREGPVQTAQADIAWA